MSYNSSTNYWTLSNSKFVSYPPCKFPKELLVEGKEFTFDGKGIEAHIGRTLPLPNQVPVLQVCIEKIY